MSVLKRKLFCGGPYRTLYWSSITQNSLLGQVHLPCRYVCVFHLIAASIWLLCLCILCLFFMGDRERWLRDLAALLLNIFVVPWHSLTALQVPGSRWPVFFRGQVLGSINCPVHVGWREQGILNARVFSLLLKNLYLSYNRSLKRRQKRFGKRKMVQLKLN